MKNNTLVWSTELDERAKLRKAWLVLFIIEWTFWLISSSELNK